MGTTSCFCCHVYCVKSEQSLLYAIYVLHELYVHYAIFHNALTRHSLWIFTHSKALYKIYALYTLHAIYELYTLFAI